MKIQAILSAALVASSEAFVSHNNQIPQTSTQLRAEIGETGVAFENVAREWRCKYSPGESGGPGDSESLKACQSLLDEYLPKLKALPGAQVTRQVCGGCLDFKVSITQPLEEHGAWAEANYEPLETEFMEKLKGIEGTSVHETQEITFEAL
mmetsp:Transcript_7692/g.13952  ORF Transcript_7692/g.13952 Transcript_7692/m.13952 type:complete len:151 (+) Transcript_7692:127-579(+)|eukprot:CAMPEP_0201608802 /NCGR_PEP_ID=MMETSP0492-20130828/8968_1 /ASSEMBLY_ACC=CAM_ASM_000837 /TAXON_ID=420259 /ORGANISM="Thalassiosira gravida, Strain GMp14c1" /LENGTH=150 /DNA_ID=CAMNT_0048073787 /DNA_START=71 /DNA_END=523 /DNA_ORIENTATION=+